MEQIEISLEATYLMHTQAMKMTKPGLYEKDVAGFIEGIALAGGGNVAFPVILSIHGEILHNHRHDNLLKDGDLLVNDSGAENELGYASDITRTFPVGGKFTQRQRDIYQVVLDAQMQAIAAIKD